MARPRSLLPLVAVALALLGFSVSSAARQPLLPRFEIEGSAFRPNLDFDVQSEAEAELAGRSLRFREEFGFDTRVDSVFLGASMRLGERSQLSFRRYSLDRDAERELERDLRFQGQTFPAGSVGRGRIRFESEQLLWTRWLGSSDRAAIGLGLGLAHFDLSARVDADVRTEAGPLPLAARGAREAWAPLLRVAGRAELGERLQVDAELSGFRKGWGSTRGDLLQARAQLLWATGPRLDLALGWEWLLVDVDPRSSSWLQAAELDIHGPRIGLRLRWP